MYNTMLRGLLFQKQYNSFYNSYESLYPTPESYIKCFPHSSTKRISVNTVVSKHPIHTQKAFSHHLGLGVNVNSSHWLQILVYHHNSWQKRIICISRTTLYLIAYNQTHTIISNINTDLILGFLVRSLHSNYLNTTLVPLHVKGPALYVGDNLRQGNISKREWVL